MSNQQDQTCLQLINEEDNFSLRRQLLLQRNHPREMVQKQNRSNQYQEQTCVLQFKKHQRKKPKKNGNFGPIAKNALAEIKKQNQITQDFIRNFVDPPEEKEVQIQEKDQNQKDIQFQDHISLPLTNQPFIQVIDIQEYFPMWLREYQYSAILQNLKVFSFNNTDGLQNHFVNIDMNTIKLLNQFLFTNQNTNFKMTPKNVEKLQLLDDTIFELTNNSIPFQESYINFAIDSQSINLSNAMNSKINQDLKLASEMFHSVLPLADQRSNNIELNAFDVELLPFPNNRKVAHLSIKVFNDCFCILIYSSIQIGLQKYIFIFSVSNLSNNLNEKQNNEKFRVKQNQIRLQQESRDNLEIVLRQIQKYENVDNRAYNNIQEKLIRQKNYLVIKLTLSNCLGMVIDHQYWNELLSLNHVQMMNTIVFYSNSELKQIKYNIEQPIFNHPRFKKILIRDLLNPTEKDENLQPGYNQIELSEPLQRLYRTTKLKYQKTLLYQLIQGRKISLDECFKLTDQEFNYQQQSFCLLISLAEQIDDYWEKISGLNFRL
ncbi:hypothetical protein ABPG72_002905, partial [Tetrahymena utriculariae]